MSHGWICHLMLQILLHHVHCHFLHDFWMLLGIFWVRSWCSSLWAQLPPQEAAAVASSAPVLWLECPGSEAWRAQSARAVPEEHKWNANSWVGCYLLQIRMGLRVIWPMEQASWPLFSQKVLYFKNPLVVHYKGPTPMQTDHSSTSEKPGWPQSVQSNKK